MNILFVCSSLLKERDGVGDYTRRLSSELIKGGHNVAILAINDKFLMEDCVEENQNEDDILIPTLRLSSIKSLDWRILIAKKFVDNFSPEWISVQYVPFGFEKRGLPFNLSKHLLHLKSNVKWHIMFHELWVGMGKEDSNKLFYWGLVQKLLIKKFIKNLSPNLIHTQTKLYKNYLKGMGFEVELLPLFTNIPIIGKNLNNREKPQKEISIAVFGAIHKSSIIESFSFEAAKFSKENNVQILLVFIGRQGAERERWANIWKSFGLKFTILGELPAIEISQALQNCSLGIISTAYAVAEKSSAFAVMRAHQLPVICIAKAWTPRGIISDAPPGLIIYEQNNFHECLTFDKVESTTFTLPEICSKFESCLIND